MTTAILNHEELVEPLADKLIAHMIKQRVQPQWQITDQYLQDCADSYKRNQLLAIDFGKVNQSLHQDLKAWKDLVMTHYKGQYRELVHWLIENLDKHDIDRDYLIKLCVTDARPSFVKTVARMVSKNEPYWNLRGELDSTDDVAVLRNVKGNEAVLGYKLAKGGSMWYIDSGYTNFITGKKLWHRLVKNHMHHNIKGLKFPADRLSMFPKFPEPWRPAGETILVVESSEEYFNMIGTSLGEWRNKIRVQLQSITNRPIEFKSKTDSRKTRVSVYEQLRTNPNQYYCVISEASAAAVEAIWCGVPAITLGQHVSTPVTRNSLNDIDNLYRGCLGDWLCALSYCQYTEEEILDGTATKFIRKYFNV